VKKTRSEERGARRGGRCRLGVTGLAAALTVGCGLSPIDHRIKLGEEPFVVFVGEGNDHNTDLFTTTTSGGHVYQLTFTRVIEEAPALAGGGTMVAFLRMRDTLPGTRRDLVIMNLENGGEKTVPLPASAGLARALGWGAGDSVVYVRTDLGLWQANIPATGDAATAVPDADSLAARQATAAWLGQPPFAEAIPCPAGICLIGPRHDTTALSETGHDPMRWGRDSVAWFEGSEIVVRSLGAGRARRVVLKDAPMNARQGSLGGTSGSP
jgi:hypothetical protein